MKTIHQELYAEAERILQFWMQRMVDEEQGGFYGRIDGHGRLYKQADKGVILNTRILWAFAAAANHFGHAAYGAMAGRACTYLLDHFVDADHGGVFWMLDCQGQPRQAKKQIYAQAFAIYALAEYYRLSREPAALEHAVALFHLIEQHSYDSKKGGYLEAFDRNWGPLADLRLSEKDANEKKTMNTHLHVLEAYTNLYRVWPDPLLQQQLVGLIDLFLQRIIDARSGHLGLFFDEDWRLKSGEISYGHDIEAAWLLTEAVEVLDDSGRRAEVAKAAVRIAGVTLAEGLDTDGGLFNEAGPHGITDDRKDWWPQAEAMVGFFNAYQLSADLRFHEAAIKSWRFIQRYLLDRKQGEWHWGVTRTGQPRLGEDKAGPWKAPYHNTRACLEMIARIGNQAEG